MQAILLGLQPGKESRDIIWNLQKDKDGIKDQQTKDKKKKKKIDANYIDNSPIPRPQPQPPALPKPSGSTMIGGKITHDSYSLAKPLLLIEINEIISNGLKRIEKDNENNISDNKSSKGTVNFSKLEVYRDAFQRFIEDSTIYRPFINAVKHEYDTVIGELLNSLKVIPDLKMEMSKIEDEAAYKARGLTLAFEIKVQELIDKNKMIQKEQEKKEKELKSYAQEMITLRNENADLKADLTETKKSCITLTHSLNRYDEEMKKVQARESSIQSDTAQLRVAVQKSTDEIEKLRALLSEMEAAQNNMVSHEVVKQQVETINTLETETKIMNATHKQLISRYSSIKSVIDNAYRNFAQDKAEASYLAKVAQAQAKLSAHNSNHHHNHHHSRKQSKFNTLIESIQKEIIDEPADDPSETVERLLTLGGSPRMVIEALIDNIEELKREIRQLQIDSGQIMLGVNEEDPIKGKLEATDDGFVDSDVFTCSWTHFIGEGFDDSVPRYMRWSGLVQNLFMTRRDVQKIMKDVWAMHSSYGLDDKKDEGKSRPSTAIQVQKPSFTTFFENYIEKIFNSHSRGIELAYNFVNSLKKFNSSSDCKCFLMILNGDIPVDLWYDQQELIKTLKESLRREEMARSHDGGKLNIDSFMRVLKKILPIKSAHLLSRLQSAIEIESKGNRDIDLDEILEEDINNGIKGPFLDLLCQQHVSEFIAIADNISTEISNICDPGAFDMPVSRFRDAILGSDPNKPRSEVNEYLARGCGKSVEDMLLLEAKRVPINVAEFKKCLFSGMIKRSPPS